MGRPARYVLALRACLWLGAAGVAHGVPAALAQAPAGIEPPRPHPGDVMRYWPAYPDDVRATGGEGTVIVRLRVTAAGVPEDIGVQRSSEITALDVAAVAAVSRWRFEPGRRDGVPVDMTVTVPIRFSLKDDAPQPEQQ